MARANKPAADDTSRRPPWIWIAAAAGAAVAAVALVYLFSAAGPGGDRLSGGGIVFAAPAGWTPADAPDEGAASWAFARPAGEGEDAQDGYATLSVVVRDLPDSLSARGFANQHGGEAIARPAAGATAWQVSRLALGAYERSAFVPLPDGATVAELRLAAGPVAGWEDKAPAEAEADFADDLAAFDAVLSSLEFAQ